MRQSAALQQNLSRLALTNARLTEPEVVKHNGC